MTTIIEVVERYKIARAKFIDEQWTEFLEKFLIVHAVYTNTVIEGSRVTSEEVSGVLNGAHLEQERAIDEQEVRNYKRALDFCVQPTQPTTEQFIKLIHAVVVHNAYQNSERYGEKPGYYRINEVRVGGQKVMTPTEDVPAHMQGLVDDYLRNLSGDLENDFDAACVFHILFEIIHPFANGNGRTGRILFTNMMRRLGLPPLVLSLDYVDMYYESFKTYQHGREGTAVRQLKTYFILCYEHLINMMKISEMY